MIRKKKKKKLCALQGMRELVKLLSLNFLKTFHLSTKTFSWHETLKNQGLDEVDNCATTLQTMCVSYTI